MIVVLLLIQRSGHLILLKRYIHTLKQKALPQRKHMAFMVILLAHNLFIDWHYLQSQNMPQLLLRLMLVGTQQSILMNPSPMD